MSVELLRDSIVVAGNRDRAARVLHEQLRRMGKDSTAHLLMRQTRALAWYHAQADDVKPVDGAVDQPAMELAAAEELVRMVMQEEGYSSIIEKRRQAAERRREGKRARDRERIAASDEAEWQEAATKVTAEQDKAQRRANVERMFAMFS